MLQASKVKAALGDVIEAGVARGLPPAWFGYHRVVHETVQNYFARHGGKVSGGRYETVHPESILILPSIGGHRSKRSFGPRRPLG